MLRGSNFSSIKADLSLIHWFVNKVKGSHQMLIITTVKPVLCDLPRVKYGHIRQYMTLNTCLIDMKCTVKGNKN